MRIAAFLSLMFFFALPVHAIAREGVVFATEEDLAAFDRMVVESRSQSTKASAANQGNVKGAGIREQVEALVKSENRGQGQERSQIMKSLKAEAQATGLRGNSGNGRGVGNAANPSDRVPVRDKPGLGKGRNK